MSHQRKRRRRRINGSGVFLLLLTSLGVLCLVIVTAMLLRNPLSRTTQAATQLSRRTRTIRAQSNLPTSTAQAMTPREIPVSPDLEQRFTVLSQARTDVCSNIGKRSAIEANLAQMAPGSFLQGSCCSPMDLTHYAQQIHALKAYATIPQIPTDPYNVPVSLAKTLVQYDQSIHLTPAQQATYTQAATMTDDHGWCCCQCWAWYAHSGLAKYLITRQHFSAAQVATVINAEDCCGGA